MNIRTRTLSHLSAIAAVSLLALTGCAADNAPVQAPTASAVTAGEAVAFEDTWIKAADDGMSAAFGTLINSGDTDITVVSAKTDAAHMVELHETVENEAGEMVMREVEGGFVIPAGGSLALEPGADHLMLMGLTGPLTAGDEVTVTVTFSDGSAQTFTAPVKDYSGANENYDADDEHADTGH